jgi:DUF1680 family protein
MKRKQFSLLALAMATSLFACKAPDGSSSVPTSGEASSSDGTAKKLAAPTVVLKDSIVSWNAIPNADYYHVYINSNEKGDVFATRYSLDSLTEAGTYLIQVSADNSAQDGVCSDLSNLLSYTVSAKDSAVPLAVTSLGSKADYTYDGTWKKVTDTVLNRQLLKADLWSGFVNQFRSNVDGDGYGWRGEFWGKMMMGATAMYEQSKDPTLYQILLTTCKDILTTQSPDGRISSYGRLSEDDSSEFYGWDIWCRKYVLMGLESFYDICQDENVKAQLLTAMERHVDYILRYIGPETGKKSILDSSSQWGGLPSCSILEGIVKLYTLSKEEKYLDFASYIVSTGGSKFGNLVAQAIVNTTLPYQWGSPKAYELTSFFNGLLSYSLTTGDADCRTAALNYAEDLLDSEITLTGGMGCAGEELNYSVIDQANPDRTGTMLETCVSVELLRFFLNVYQATGDVRYVDSAERTLYNALIGAVDMDCNYDHAFTSYFNLVFGIKTRSAAGGMHMAERDYGCCISFGSAGTGAIHRYQIVENGADRYLLNFYLPGTVSFALASGQKVKLTTETNYPYSGLVSMKVGLEGPAEFRLGLRIPSWSKQTTIAVNGMAQTISQSGFDYLLERTWQNGDLITMKMDMNPRLYWGSRLCLNKNAQYNVAINYGPLVLARDRRLDEGNIFQTIHMKTIDGAPVLTASKTAAFFTQAEFSLSLEDGTNVHLIDYASAGKTYDLSSLYTVFMPTTDYWNKISDMSKKLVLVSEDNSALISLSSDGSRFQMGGFYYDHENELGKCAFNITDRGDSYYSLDWSASGLSLTADGATAVPKAYDGGDDQLFKIDRLNLVSYAFISKSGGALLSVDGDGLNLHLYSDCSSPKQRWKIINA